MPTFSNTIEREEALLGLVGAEGVVPDQTSPGFDAALARLLDQRTAPLTATEQARRQQVRALLRNGRYKPTGRGKPASEYLLRAAQQPERRFPRINGPVDVCNHMSLKTLLPVSLWDHTRAATDAYVFRLGLPGEAYVFNEGGQTIDLHDLIVGCRVQDGAPHGEPCVNPVKDSLATKTTAQSQAVCACIYASQEVITPGELGAVCATFAEWLSGCGPAVRTACGVVRVGASLTLEVPSP